MDIQCPTDVLPNCAPVPKAIAPMPTSPYGVFLGFDSSVRVVQVSG
jgi:hypothetical protein